MQEALQSLEAIQQKIVFINDTVDKRKSTFEVGD